MPIMYNSEWVTAGPAMSQTLLTQICLWVKMPTMFPHMWPEQRDQDYIAQTKNMCACLWSIIHAGKSYLLYMLGWGMAVYCDLCMTGGSASHV